MTRKTMLALLAVLAIGIMTIPAYADTISPLKQFDMGVPLDEIQCNDDKILLQSASGKPYCLSESTAAKLADRGFTLVKLEEKTEINYDDTKDSLSFSDSVKVKLGVSQNVNKSIELAWFSCCW